MAEPFTIYKLTILNMLDKVDFPLTNTQISNFFLEQDYTDYFRVQQVISDLVDADLIHAESTHSNTQYTIACSNQWISCVGINGFTSSCGHNCHFLKNLKTC